MRNLIRAAVMACLLFPGVAPAAGPVSALVRTRIAAMRDLVETITAYGAVRADPDSESSISIARDGLIDHIHVRLGERVAAGTPLLVLETSPAARMAYQQAVAAVDYARSNAERTQRLFSENLATNDQVTAAKQSLRDAEAQLKAQQKVGASQSAETLRAPFDGIVTRLLVSQGERVQANTTALILARANALIVPLGIEPEDAVMVKRGMPVTLTSLFQAGLHIKSEIDQIHAMVDPATRLVEGIARIAPQDTGQLMLGMQVKGNIAVRRTSSLAVPAGAVLSDEDGSYLFVVDKGHARRVNVTTGIEQGNFIGVSGALHAGDRVVITGNYELRDGMAVREAPE